MTVQFPDLQFLGAIMRAADIHHLEIPEEYLVQSEPGAVMRVYRDLMRDMYVLDYVLPGEVMEGQVPGEPASLGPGPS